MTTSTRAAPAPCQPDRHFDSFGTILLLSLVFGIAAFGTDMYLPAFPAMRRSLDATPQAIQLSLSVFLYGNALGHLVFGPLSDRYGRKPVLLIGLGAFAFASFGCAIANDVTALLVYRTAQGAASASAPVLVRALINDRLDRDEAARRLALLTGLMALAAMLTPTLGGWLVQYRPWQWIFYCLGTLSLLLLVFATFGIRETLTRDKRLPALGAGEVFGTYFSIASDLRFWSYVLPPSLMFSGVFAYAVVNSFLLIDDLGLSARAHGVSYSVAAFAYVAGSLTSHRLLRRTGIDRAILIGLWCGSIAALVAVTASALLPLSVPLVMLPGIAMFFCTSLILPIGFSVAVSLFPRRGGSASAVAGFTQLGFAGLSSGVAAYLYDGSAGPLHQFTLACCIAAGGLWFAGRGLRQRIREAKAGG